MQYALQQKMKKTVNDTRLIFFKYLYFLALKWYLCWLLYLYTLPAKDKS